MSGSAIPFFALREFAKQHPQRPRGPSAPQIQRASLNLAKLTENLRDSSSNSSASPASMGNSPDRIARVYSSGVVRILNGPRHLIASPRNAFFSLEATIHTAVAAESQRGYLTNAHLCWMPPDRRLSHSCSPCWPTPSHPAQTSCTSSNPPERLSTGARTRPGSLDSGQAAKRDSLWVVGCPSERSLLFQDEIR